MDQPSLAEKSEFTMREDIKEIITMLGAYVIKLSGCGEDLDKNKELILENIKNGKAYKKFLELVSKQGGDTSYIEDTSKFEKAKSLGIRIMYEDEFLTLSK